LNCDHWISILYHPDQVQNPLPSNFREHFLSLSSESSAFEAESSPVGSYLCDPLDAALHLSGYDFAIYGHPRPARNLHVARYLAGALAPRVHLAGALAPRAHLAGALALLAHAHLALASSWDFLGTLHVAHYLLAVVKALPGRPLAGVKASPGRPLAVVKALSGQPGQKTSRKSFSNSVLPFVLCDSQ
jgi:hypothetical protein